MRWEDFRMSDHVDDRRGGGGGMGIPMGRGGLGIGTTIVLTLAGWALGIDPRILISGAEMMGGGGSGYVEPAPRQGAQPAPRGQKSAPPQDQMGRFASAIL